ncbi:MAG TPA: 30S ribosome-binding factor RbfA, partial [Candidatus Eisenbacteria bacterium]|nr:30S ribosome-binding factor RbfA [Candidatus Eisenbacteria bacterium]
MTKRTLRIDELLREEIGSILTREVDDPRIGFATVTDVETAPDLSHARVWVSVIGQPDERDATLAALGRAMPFVRRQLGGRIKLRRIPELHLRLDESLQRGTRVLHLLSELKSGEPVDAPGPAAESLPTPVARLPHEGDAPDAPIGAGESASPAPRRRRRRRAAGSSGTNRQRR